MKKTISCAAVSALLMLCAAPNISAQGEQMQVEVGAGITISPNYGDLLDDVYPGYDFSFGGYGWLDLHVGLRFNATDQLSLTPTLGLLLNYTIADGGPRDESYLNSIILPSIALRYTFAEVPSLYAGGEVNYGIPNTGSDYYEFDSGGVGFGAFLGYAFDGGWSVEAGYSHVPIEVGTLDENIGGGVLFRFGKTL